MRRRRNSRSRKRKDRINAASVIMLLVVAAVFVYVFQALDIGQILTGQGKASPTPSVSIGWSSAPASNDASPEPTVTPVSGRVSEEIKMNGTTLYGVQLGVFSKEENARTAAEAFKAQGFGGYILQKEGLFRVMDSVYYNQDDAKTVRDAFKTGAATDACLMKVSVTGATWNVSATREQVQAIRNALLVMQTQLVALIDTQKKLGQNPTGIEDYRTTIYGSIGKFNDAANALMQAVGSTNASTVLSLNDSLKESASNLQKLLDTTNGNPVAFTSGLKYNIIDILLKLERKLSS